MELIALNVGGTIFEITEDCLKSFPKTRLANLSASSPEFIEDKKQYFFNRNPEIFNYILDLYRTGSLHLPTNVCGATVRNELEFWGIPVENLSECCIKTYFKYDSDVEKVEEINLVFDLNATGYSEEVCQNSKWTRFKRNVWIFMDQPTSSIPAKIFGMVFMLIVSLSVILAATESLPQFRQQIHTDEESEQQINISKSQDICKKLDFDNDNINMLLNTKAVDWITYTEIFLYIFFSLEFIIRFYFSPNRIKFYCNFLNSLDAVIFVTMWTTVILNKFLGKEYRRLIHDHLILFLIVATIPHLRLLKIFRLLKCFPGLHLLCMSIKWNLKDLVILFTTFISLSCLFGTIIFLCEINENSTFPNVFVGIWWAVITMTTVGYGDHYPKSGQGCVLGILCSICGIMFLAMPIALLSSNFNECYKRYNDKKRFQAYKNTSNLVKNVPV